MLWLWGIIVNLLTYSGYYDIALRDFGLSMGALALGRLAWAHRLEPRGNVAVEREPPYSPSAPRRAA